MPEKPHVLFATEGGVGRGHVATLRLFAEAFGQELQYDASLHYMAVADELRDVCGTVFQGASLSYDSSRRVGPDRVRTATWGEYLGDLGFRDPGFLIHQIGWWREVIAARHIAMVVADFAPCALLAARTMGIASVAMATGYEIPADGLKEFPVFIPEFSRRLYDEQEMVRAVNVALGHFGAAPIRHFPEIYDVSAKLVRTVPLLDSYDGLRTEGLLSPIEFFPVPERSGRREIYAYFSNIERDPPALLDALCALELPVRAMIPRLPAAQIDRLRASGAIVQTVFAPLEELTRRTSLMLNNGQHLTLCMGLAAGIPQVCLPQHLEQLTNARRVAVRGAARVIENSAMPASAMAELIASAYHDRALADAACGLMPEVRAGIETDNSALIRARIGPILAGLAAA